MAFCPHCGATVPDGAAYCASCGKPIAAPAANPWGADALAAKPGQRPIGALLAAIYHFVFAGFLVLAGLFVMLGFSLFQRFMPDYAGMKGMMAGIAAVVGVLVIGFAVLMIFVGKGLLDGQKWAWIVAVVLLSLSALGGLGSVFDRNGGAGVTFLLDVAVLVLLVIPQTRTWYFR